MLYRPDVAANYYEIKKAFKELDIITRYYQVSGLGEFILEEHVCSPLRADNSPGAKWVHDYDGIKFEDYADSEYKIRDIYSFISAHSSIAWKDLPKFIIEIMSDPNLQLDLFNVSQDKPKYKKKKTKINYRVIPFDIRAKEYWSTYGISKSDLEDDKVFQIDRLSMEIYKKTGAKYLDIDISKAHTYLYSDFETGVKTYTPFPKQGCRKFHTNIFNEIGNRKIILNPKSKTLFITKSYKDYRVIYNSTNKDTIWCQSESLFPNKENIETIENSYKKVFICFDNDKAGKEGSLNLSKLFSKIETEIVIPAIGNDFAEQRALNKPFKMIYNE